MFTMMIGLPGSGKSTIAKKRNGVLISSDNIRAEFCVDSPFEIMRKQLLENINRDVILDATNLTCKSRRGFLTLVKSKGVKTKAIVVLASVEDCIKRQEQRDRKVPRDVIENFAKSFQFPMPYEFDEIEVIQNSLDKREIEDISQDNRHHTLSLFGHLTKTKEIAESLTEDSNLIKAALNHDIGKYFTKSFTNRLGEHTDEAHYYGHECYGAYYYLTTHQIDDDTIEVARLINYHMRPYVWRISDKAYERDLKVLGKEMADKLRILHEADEGAH